MRERNVDIPTADGRMDTFITHPEGSGPYPVVILYMDAPGIRGELYDFARRVGTVGYLCLVPDLYYREGRIRITADQLNDAMRRQLRAIWHNMSNAMVLEDTRSILHFLAEQPAAAGGPLGCIGYCMSGQWVLSAAGTFPDRFRATATLHGVRHVTDKPDSPHLLAPRFRGELYAGFAEHDHAVPQAEVDALALALRCAGVRHQVEVHPGTRHGYSFPERAAYDKPAAERNWERIFAMFHRQIPPHA